MQTVIAFSSINTMWFIPLMIFFNQLLPLTNSSKAEQAFMVILLPFLTYSNGIELITGES